jgi:hypothetical protein
MIMTTPDVDLRRTTPVADDVDVRRRPETKTFLASSEFWVFGVAVAAMLFAGYVINDITNSTSWKYITWLAIAYVVSRGLAKAGSQRDYETVARGYDRDRRS